MLSASVFGFKTFCVERKSIKSEEEPNASDTPSLTNTTASPSEREVLQSVGRRSSRIPSGKELPSTIFTASSVITKEYGEPILIKSALPVNKSITPASKAVKLSSPLNERILLTVESTVSEERCAL